MQLAVTPADGLDAEAMKDDAITHLASLTAQRDRELLDVSLAQGVLELLSARSVGVYRLLGNEGEARHWLCCGLARKGQLTVSDPPWVDMTKLPPEAAHPARVAVLASRSLAQTEGAAFTTLLPLMVELGLPGVLEVCTEGPLSITALRPIQTLLKVFDNFQSLLESSQRDALTGLLNRQTFDATFMKASMPPAAASALTEPLDDRRAVALAADGQLPGYWLGVIDIDHFKRVNDGFGHLIGDEVLVLMARIMRQSFRHHDRLYRFGGEEFVVLLRGGTEKDALGAFERFRRNVASYAFPQVQHVTVSVGYSEIQRQDTPSDAFSRADQAVYEAKRQGRNQTLCFDSLVRQGVLVSGTHQHVGDVELF